MVLPRHLRSLFELHERGGGRHKGANATALARISDRYSIGTVQPKRTEISASVFLIQALLLNRLGVFFHINDMHPYIPKFGTSIDITYNTVDRFHYCIDCVPLGLLGRHHFIKWIREVRRCRQLYPF
jgi:hypothetical protein